MKQALEKRKMQPAADGEEAELVQRAARGDGQACGRLVERYAWVAACVARRYVSVWDTFEDLLSVAYLGVVKGANGIRPQRLHKLSSFIFQCAENEVRMYLRRSKKNRRELSLEQTVSVDRDGKERRLSECIAAEGDDVCDGLVEKERSRELHAAIRALDEVQQDILEMRFGLNGKRVHTQREVAERYGVTQSHVSKTERKLLANMRRRMEQQQ